MKGDFSRDSFDPNKHYRGVRMQQGRVQMDADWNEQIDITDYSNRLFTEDFLGEAVGPSIGAGFAIGVTTDQQNLTIGLGRYYVNGLLLENSSSVYFTAQTDNPQATLPTQDGVYLAYLDVWQRSLSITDDADMAESALGGADTATRLYNVAQVKLMPIDSTGITNLTFNTLFDPTAKVDSPAYNNAQQWNALSCRLPATVNSVQLWPDVNHTKTNTAYRIQIHQGGQVSAASYKVSTDSSFVQIEISTISVNSSNNTTTITVKTQPTTAFATEQWLELTTPNRDADKLPGDMLQINTVTGDSSQGFTLILNGVAGMDITIDNDAQIKRWQQNALPVTESTQNPLEAGLIIHFLGNAFESGGYWQITTANNTINWPSHNGQFVALPPQFNTISQLTPSVSDPPKLQNQLYRVEIHQGSKDKSGNLTTPTFKWSRDNGSVSSSINTISSNNGNSANSYSITLDTLPQDGINGFMIYQWLELTTPTRELTGVPGDMVQITAVNSATLSVTGSIGSDITVANNAIARRWDTAVTGGSEQAVNNIVSTPLTLENGLSITFSGSDFYTSDYWLIPARAAINSQSSPIDWPMDDGDHYLMQSPTGIQHSFAPLAIVQRSDSMWIFESDARTLATPLGLLDVIGVDPGAPADTIHVDKYGQVGITTDTPNAKLDVETSTAMKGQDAIHAVASSSNGIAIQATTNDSSAAVLKNNSTQPTMRVINNGSGHGVTVNIEMGNAVKLTNNSSQAETLYAENLGNYRAGTFSNHSELCPSLVVENDSGPGGSFTSKNTIYPALYAENELGPAGGFVNTQDSTYPTLYARSCDGPAGNFINNSATSSTLYIINQSNGQALQTTGNVAIDGSLTIRDTNSGSFSVTPAPNKIPVADESGHINSNWIIDNNLGLRIIRGSINGNITAQSPPGTPFIKSGTGFTVQWLVTGRFKVFFNTPFSSRPSGVATQLFSAVTGGTSGHSPYDDMSGNYPGSTLDNAVIMGIDTTAMVISVGDNAGHNQNRDFEFIVIGPA